MFQRQILSHIEKFLFTTDILLLYGARQVGKTSVMKILQEKEQRKTFFFDLEQKKYLTLLNQDQEDFILYLKNQGRKEDENIVVFIDEIQYLEDPTSFLKYLHDHYPQIKFIVSWSSTLEIRGKLRNSMVGRMLTFEIYPLNFQEFLVFKGVENLASLVRNPISLEITNQEILPYYQEYLIYGGYPQIALTKTVEEKKIYLKQIVSTYIEKDIRDIGKINEIEKFNKMLIILAEQSGNLLNISELSSDSVDVARETLKNRLFLLENTFVIRQITPYSNNVRSELVKMPKVFFEDNGIRNALLNTFEITGNGLETVILNDLSHSYRFGKIQFYRTKDQKEIDFILDSIPYEVKMAYNGKRLNALDFFHEKYGTWGKVIALKKHEKSLYPQFYPWEI